MPTPVSTTPIRFVYFDLGNILCAFDRDRAAANLAKLLGVDFALTDSVLHGAGLQERFEHGHLSGDRYVDLVCEGVGLSSWADRHDDGRAAAVAAVHDAISDMFTPVAGMDVIAATVRRCVGRIGVLSNTCEAHWDWIVRQRYPVLSVDFDEIVLSCRVGSMKPDDAIYRIAEQQAGCDPASILFIDDRVENVRAARRHGWRAEACLGGDEAKDVFTRYGLMG